MLHLCVGDCDCLDYDSTYEQLTVVLSVMIMMLTTSVLETHPTFITSRHEQAKLGLEYIRWGKLITGIKEKEVKGPWIGQWEIGALKMGATWRSLFRHRQIKQSQDW